MPINQNFTITRAKGGKVSENLQPNILKSASATPQLKTRLLISSHENLLGVQVSEGDSSRAATAASEDRSVTIADRLEKNEIRYQENLQPNILESASAMGVPSVRHT